jgi:hypothetical protein
VVSDLVTHDLHDVVAVCDETKRKRGGENSKLPDGDRSRARRSHASVPGAVDNSPRTDSVSDIVGTVSERGSASSENLDERVGVFDLVGILGGVAVDTSHTLTLGGAFNTSLCSVDVVVCAVEDTDNEHGGNTLEGDDHVLLLVDFTILDLVLVEVAHSPAEVSLLSSESGVESVLGLVDTLLVGHLAVLGHDKTLLVVGSGDLVGRAVALLVLLDDVLIVVLNNGVVGNDGRLDAFGGRAPEEEGTLEHVPPANSVVLLDNASVKVGDEEQEGQQSKADTAADGDGCNVPGRLLVEFEVGRSLVDDGEGADGSGDEEEERSGPDGDGDGVLAEVNSELDQQEDDGTEASRGSGSHSQTGEDGTETLALVPSPLDIAGARNRDTNTGNGRDERVG